MHADAQWCLWAPRRSWGIFNFTEEEVIVFFSSVVGLQAEQTPERNIAYGKKIHIELKRMK